METRELGSSGIMVPPLCLGGNVFGWTVDEPHSFQLLDALLAAGLNFVDTADMYSNWAPGNRGGESETILGKWFRTRKNRRQVILATKVGLPMRRYHNRPLLKALAGGSSGLSKRYIRQAVEDSLRRLQTDSIDLYQAHRDDEGAPQEETLAAFGDLIAEGKVRAIGASNFSAARLESALEISRKLGLPRYESLQPRYNLYDRADYEWSLEGVSVRNGLGVIPYFSLASGFLTGKYQSAEDAAGRARAGMVKGYFTPRGMRILAALAEVSHELSAKPGQVALAWLMARPGITAPIASATSVEQLHELVAATTLELGAEAMAKLNQASAEDAVAA